MQYGSLLEQLKVKKTRFVKSRILPPWLDEEVRNEMKVCDELKSQKYWSGYQIKRKISNRRFEFETNTPCFSIESDIGISPSNSKLSIATLYRSRTECYCLFSLPYLAGI